MLKLKRISIRLAKNFFQLFVYGLFPYITLKLIFTFSGIADCLTVLTGPCERTASSDSHRYLAYCNSLCFISMGRSSSQLHATYSQPPLKQINRGSAILEVSFVVTHARCRCTNGKRVSASVLSHCSCSVIGLKNGRTQIWSSKKYRYFWVILNNILATTFLMNTIVDATLLRSPELMTINRFFGQIKTITYLVLSNRCVHAIQKAQMVITAITKQSNMSQYLYLHSISKPGRKMHSAFVDASCIQNLRIAKIRSAGWEHLEVLCKKFQTCTSHHPLGSSIIRIHERALARSCFPEQHYAPLLCLSITISLLNKLDSLRCYVL